MAAPARGGPTDPSHDAQLRRGVLPTEVSRPVAALLVGLFLGGAAAVPIAQAVRDRRNGDPSVLPDLFARWPTQDTIRQFEEDLEKASAPREWVRPRLQAVLTRWGRFGNTKVVVGRDDWLFYQPGLAAVGGPGFLQDDVLASRTRAARDAGEAAVFPDPRPAILDLHAYLAARGIALVVFPVPDKAALQQGELHGRRGRTADTRGDHAVPRNPDQDRLVGQLAAAGVLVFDPTPQPLAPVVGPRFLRQDTHWTPAWMEQVSADLARLLTERGLIEVTPAAPAWPTVEKTVSRVGDLVDMLGLPTGQTLFAPQAVVVHQVSTPEGAPFEATARADVLLLGDSFSNVFTLDQMGWGENAGLAPHLARALRRPVDVIAQNDAGAHATRQLLWNELASPPPEGDRLAGKRVVIWEFASRELAVGNWKPLVWPRPPDARGVAP